jgi:copper transport protein
MMRRFARLAAAGVVSGWLVLAAAAPASAHALLASSRPGANATVQAPPSALSLTFTEPPDPALSSVQLLGESGATVSLGRPQTDGRTMTVPITGSVADGTYTVNWRVVSKTDGHVTAGSFAFGVGRPPSEPSSGARSIGESSFPSAGSVAAKWLLYAGLSLALAAPVVGLVVLRQRHLPPAAVVGGAAAAFVGAIGLVGAEAAAIGVGVTTFLRSGAGRSFLWLSVATLVMLAVAVAWASSRRTWLLWAVAGGSAVAMLIRSIGGHADAGRFPALEVAAQFVHFGAVAVWIGGLAWLLMLLRSVPAIERAEDVRRFSTTAGIALALVVLTGGVRLVDELGGPSHLSRLFSTDYGWTLVVKIAATIVLIGAGAWNRYVNVPRSANGANGVLSLRRVVTAELVLAAGVFAATGVLTGLPPAVSSPVSSAHRPAGVTVSGSDFATTMRARLEIAPGTVGSNRFDLHVEDYDTHAPVPARRVTLRFFAVSTPTLASSTLQLRKASAGNWTAAGSEISVDDRWRIVATVQTFTTSTQIPFEMSPRVPTGRLTVSSAPGQPTLYTTTYRAGSSMQTYLDPGTIGSDQLHATAFDAKGDELPLRSISLVAIAPDGTSTALEPQRFTPGHFAANVQITTAGRWTFEVRARSTGGASLDTRFSQGFGGTG